jgi:hypothetical protein
MGHRETPIQKKMLDWLGTVKGVKFTRTQAGAVRKGSRWIRFGESGWFDITGVAFGYPVGIEVKAPGVRTDKKREENQQKTREEWIECGGKAYKVESLEELKIIIGDIERKRPF